MSHKLYCLPRYPEIEIFGCLFTNVTNLEEIKKGVISLAPEYDFCFINSGNIISLDQLNCSIMKTVTAYKYNKKKKLRSNSIYTEFLLNLSPSVTITDSLNKFGISKDSKSLIILKIKGIDKYQDSINPEEELKNLGKIINGELTELNDESLVKFVSFKNLRKNYKISTDLMSNNPNILSQLLIGIIELSSYR